MSELNFMDVLGHSPEILADEKIRAMMSDIYDNLIEYAKGENSEAISSIISEYGTTRAVETFIDDVYLKGTDDVKVMSYVSEHKEEIIDIMVQALSNLTPKEVLNTMDEEKVDGSDDATRESGKSDEVTDELEDESDKEKKQNPEENGTQEQNLEQPFVQTENEPSAEPEQPEEPEASDSPEHDKAYDFISNLLKEQ